MTVAEVIVGVLGAGILGMLGFFFSSIKSDIRALGKRLDRHEEILISLVERTTKIETVQEEHGRLLAEHGRRLTTIEATLAEHGRLLSQMKDHGERIAALESRAAAG